MRKINIKRVMNGFVVDVGCQTLVFETADKFIAELKRYLDSPDATEKEYTAQYGLAGCDVAVAPPATPYPSTASAIPLGAYGLNSTYQAYATSSDPGVGMQASSGS